MAGNKKTVEKLDKSSKGTNKPTAKGKGKEGKEDKLEESSGGKLKAATSINARHILVGRRGVPLFLHRLPTRITV